jgi:2-keto-4-pentenoate hydratase/2-oxohepta-3-ene-1,7-dioic acid hydratase in catechol pathway
LLDDNLLVDLSDVVADYNEAFFGSGRIATLAPLIAERAAAGQAVPLGDRRLGAPFARPHQILCIGLNYSDHAAETGQPIPAEPIVFNKAPNTLTGPNDDVLIPRGSVKTDWEVELGVVIGKRCLYLADEAAAADAIAGYVLVNDISEREWQIERGGQWVKGKSAPTFNPAGPWLATPDEIDDVANLDMSLDVDEKRYQKGSTSKMIFGPLFLVHYVSQFLALEPGDLINTGTPAGVGLGQKPPTYLHGGETVRLSVSGLGTQTQSVIPDTHAGR